MLLTLENGLNIDLLFPEKSFYRVSNVRGYYKDFGTLDEAQSFVKYDFFNYYTVYKVIQILDDFGKITDTKLFKVDFSMDNQIFYTVILNTWNYEWEDFETYYFKTEAEANLKAEELEKGTYHCKYSINVSQITFEKMKETITVNEFEELFGIIITADGKIVKEN